MLTLAAEFQVHLCADVRFNGSVDKRAIDIILPQKRGNF